MTDQTSQIFFSVIIPTYNRAILLQRSVKSVLEQTFSNFELLICDDASTDNTEVVVRKFADIRIKYLRLKLNGGNAAARNLGSRNASGKYVTYLDSDDAYHPIFLEEMYKLIERHVHPGFLWCRVNRIKGSNIVQVLWPASWRPESAKDTYAYFLKAIYFGTDFGFTVRKDCFETVGYFDENLRVAVDTDFILRIVQHFKFAYTTEILIDTYEHPGERVRKNTLEKWKSYSILIEKHRAKIEKDPVLVGRWYYKLMWLAYHSNNKQQARKYWYYFAKRLAWKPIVLGLLFEFLPLDQATYWHKKISSGKKQASVPLFF